MDQQCLLALKDALTKGEPLAKKLRAAAAKAPSAGLERALTDLAAMVTNGLQGFVDGEERRLAQMAEIEAAGASEEQVAASAGSDAE